MNSGLDWETKTRFERKEIPETMLRLAIANNVDGWKWIESSLASARSPEGWRTVHDNS